MPSMANGFFTTSHFHTDDPGMPEDIGSGGLLI